MVVPEHPGQVLNWLVARDHEHRPVVQRQVRKQRETVGLARERIDGRPGSARQVGVTEDPELVSEVFINRSRTLSWTAKVRPEMTAALAWLCLHRGFHVSDTGFDFRRRHVTALAAGLIVFLAGVTWVFKVVLNRPAPVALGEGLRVSLSVEPFEVGDSVPSDWGASSFADSFATRLSLIRGIQAASHSANALYVLRGHVTMKDGRLILATWLGRDGTRDTVWTATFWRSAQSGHTVLTDLAQAVAEAVFAESAREPLSIKREKRWWALACSRI